MFVPPFFLVPETTGVASSVSKVPRLHGVSLRSVCAVETLALPDSSFVGLWLFGLPSPSSMAIAVAPDDVKFNGITGISMDF